MLFFEQATNSLVSSVASSSNASIQPEEEGDVAHRDGDDIDVLEQVDLNQVDDGLISPALADFGRQHPSPRLIGLVFSILKRRDSSIVQEQSSTWESIGRVSVTVLRSVCEVFSQMLKHEYKLVNSRPMVVPYKWDEWIQISIRFLISMSQNTWFTPEFRKSVSDCLSVAHPDIIDSLLSGWSDAKEKSFTKQVILSIDPTLLNTDELRPLTLRNIPDRLWQRAIPLIEEMIFPEYPPVAPYVWSQDTSIAFRALLGEHQRTIPQILHQKIRDTFGTDQLVEQLLGPISTRHLQGNGQMIAAYVFRLLYLFAPPGTLEFPNLAEPTRKVVHGLLVGALRDELDLRSKSAAHKFARLDEVFLDAVYVVIAFRQHGNDENGSDAISSFFTQHLDIVADGIVKRLSQGSTHHALPILIPVLFRTFLDMNGNYGDEPWNHTVRIPTDPSIRDILVNVTARCLTTELEETNNGTNSNVSLWFKWGIHLLLSCFESDTRFSDSTVGAITTLVSPNPQIGRAHV